ncbi:MAG: 2-C-methyl-D-erythritol 2,4-cyclodiphosphate synthase [Lachnospiraceae bacterium]|nr:2-C-methyl-D-erythritol 2,4-cyclodiphosphate synthase [Lachnospiraceae bacterium]
MYRIGEGYDVHKLTDGRELILGGVKVPYEKGLLGHSDADVLTHAIMDALLGALALGDIGKHFPDSDDRYKGASSIDLLKKVSGIIDDNVKTQYTDSANKFSICNIDATIICEKPKLRDYIDGMRENISKALAIDIKKVSIKATTEEGLGFTGEGLGIAAKAIALIEI